MGRHEIEPLAITTNPQDGTQEIHLNPRFWGLSRMQDILMHQKEIPTPREVIAKCGDGTEYVLLSTQDIKDARLRQYFELIDYILEDADEIVIRAPIIQNPSE